MRFTKRDYNKDRSGMYVCVRVNAYKDIHRGNHTYVINLFSHFNYLSFTLNQSGWLQMKNDKVKLET